MGMVAVTVYGQPVRTVTDRKCRSEASAVTVVTVVTVPRGFPYPSRTWMAPSLPRLCAPAHAVPTLGPDSG